MTSFFPVRVKESNGRNNNLLWLTWPLLNWNVAQVKQDILLQSGLQAHQFKLVFAGQELRDNMIDWLMSLDSTIRTSRSSMVEWNNTKHIQEQQLLTNYLINYIHYKQKYKIQLPQKQPHTITIKYNTSNVQKQTNNQVYNK